MESIRICFLMVCILLMGFHLCIIFHILMI